MARFWKGFVFSIDALLAAITMGIFLTALLFMSSQTSEKHATEIQLQKQAGDALAVLDKSGVLGSGNITLMNETLTSLLPPFAKWSMGIQYDNYSDGNFVPSGQVEFGSNGNASGEMQVGERRFVSFENNSVKNYGFARLKLWSKN
jgi:hypothetical protein